MIANGRVDRIEFCLVGEPHVQDLRAHRADEIGADGASRVSNRIRRRTGVDVDIGESGVAVKLGEAASYVRVGPLRVNAMVKISRRRSNAGCGG